MEKGKKQVTAKQMDEVLGYFMNKLLSEESDKTEQEIIKAKIQNLKSIKELISKNDCYYCWKCIKNNIKYLNPLFWIINYIKNL